jgi:hypothetical protein
MTSYAATPGVRLHSYWDEEPILMSFMISIFGCFSSGG